MVKGGGLKTERSVGSRGREGGLRDGVSTAGAAVPGKEGAVLLRRRMRGLVGRVLDRVEKWVMTMMSGAVDVARLGAFEVATREVSVVTHIFVPGVNDGRLLGHQLVFVRRLFQLSLEARISPDWTCVPSYTKTGSMNVAGSLVSHSLSCLIAVNLIQHLPDPLQIEHGRHRDHSKALPDRSPQLIPLLPNLQQPRPHRIPQQRQDTRSRQRRQDHSSLAPLNEAPRHSLKRKRHAKTLILGTDSRHAAPLEAPEESPVVNFPASRQDGAPAPQSISSATIG
ncbi:hypothetical protein HYQ46_000682 [Verticillium longisporum]|nr:hypothetical protein HYQ46_000682 [Verticillium longisporum]